MALDDGHEDDPSAGPRGIRSGIILGVGAWAGLVYLAKLLIDWWIGAR